MHKRDVDRLQDAFRAYDAVVERYQHLLAAAANGASRQFEVKVSHDRREMLFHVPISAFVKWERDAVVKAIELVRSCGGTLDDLKEKV